MAGPLPCPVMFCSVHFVPRIYVYIPPHLFFLPGLVPSHVHPRTDCRVSLYCSPHVNNKDSSKPLSFAPTRGQDGRPSPPSFPTPGYRVPPTSPHHIATQHITSRWPDQPTSTDQRRIHKQSSEDPHYRSARQHFASSTSAARLCNNTMRMYFLTVKMVAYTITPTDEVICCLVFCHGIMGRLSCSAHESKEVQSDFACSHSRQWWGCWYFTALPWM